MTTESLERAFASSRQVLAALTPDKLHDPTPCASWDVAALVNHMVGGAYWFAASMTGAPPEGDSPDFASGDFLASYDDAAGKAVAAFAAEGALGRTVTLPFGAMPGAAFLGLATTDAFTHGWDLAKAIGLDHGALDPELATQLLAASEASIADAFRGDDGTRPFGPQQPAPDDAPPADRLAAFLGRRL